MIQSKSILQSISLILLLSVASAASAQLGGSRIDRPIDTPTFSPYINMLRDNSSPGLNYFGLVRPQLEFAQQNQQLGQNFQALQMQQNQGMRSMPGSYGYSQLGLTGHPVAFNTFSSSRFGGGYSGGASGGNFGGGVSGGGFGGGGMNSGMGNAGFGGQSNFGGGMNSGNSYGGMMMGPGGAGPGFSGMSGHSAQFGGIGNSSMTPGGGR